jgi:hypothetical protein
LMAITCPLVTALAFTIISSLSSSVSFFNVCLA